MDLGAETRLMHAKATQVVQLIRRWFVGDLEQSIAVWFTRFGHVIVPPSVLGALLEANDMKMHDALMRVGKWMELLK